MYRFGELDVARVRRILAGLNLSGLGRHLKRLAAQHGAAAQPDGREDTEDRSTEEMFAVEMKMISRRERHGEFVRDHLLFRHLF